MVGQSWGKLSMDALERDLRAMLAASGVSPDDQSSILHLLAAEVDIAAVLPEPGINEYMQSAEHRQKYYVECASGRILYRGDNGWLAWLMWLATRPWKTQTWDRDSIFESPGSWVRGMMYRPQHRVKREHDG